MSDEEAKALMDAVLGGFREQRARLDGLTHEVAKLSQRITALEERVGAVEQGLADLREELHEGLTGGSAILAKRAFFPVLTLKIARNVPYCRTSKGTSGKTWVAIDLQSLDPLFVG